jgi:hypothetical protein
MTLCRSFAPLLIFRNPFFFSSSNPRKSSIIFKLFETVFTDRPEVLKVRRISFKNFLNFCYQYLANISCFSSFILFQKSSGALFGPPDESFFLFFFPLPIFSSLFFVSLPSLASSFLIFSFYFIFHFFVFLFSSPFLPHSLP